MRRRSPSESEQACGGVSRQATWTPRLGPGEILAAIDVHQVYPCLRQAGWTIEPGIRDARIGGSRRADRNLISGNNIGGIYVGIGDSLKTRGNLIGVTAHDLVFGGDTATKANVVAHAFRDGIAIDGTGTGTGVSVWILRSSIHANGDLAIDLGIDGVTPWT